MRKKIEWNKIDWSKYIPPGIDYEREKLFFLAGMTASLFYSVFYIDCYWDAYQSLWEWHDNTLRRGAVIDPFWELVDNYPIGYLMVALSMFAVAAGHYAHYWQGSKSIYLVRRLPDRGYLRRTCWTIPLLWMGISLLTGAITLLVYFAIYVGFTPWECLPW